MTSGRKRLQTNIGNTALQPPRSVEAFPTRRQSAAATTSDSRCSF